jgi:hypothetical protein
MPSVNLGGWLVTERKSLSAMTRTAFSSTAFIVSNLYEQYQTTTPVAVDEYTLSQA